MKRLKDVIARKRPAARASDANDRDSVKDFSEILGERRPPQARAEPSAIRHRKSLNAG